MEWQTIRNGASEDFLGHAGDSTLREAFAALWQKVLSDVIPRHDDAEWRFIKAEFWTDSGRVIVFPTASAETRDERSACQLVIPELQSWWDELSSSDLPDDEFEDAVNDRLTSVADEFFAALTDAGAGSPRSLAVKCFSADEEEPFAERTIAVS